jgi:small subunit ribosomal protein S20
VKTFARNEVRDAIAQIEDGGDGAAAVKAAARAIDRAAQKGLIHKNSAARTKSRLMKRANAAQASA